MLSSLCLHQGPFVMVDELMELVARTTIPTGQ